MAETGPKLRILTVVDTFGRFSPAVVPRFAFRAPDVVEVLERVCIALGYPASIRVGQPIIPQRTCMPRQKAFDPAKYKLRNRVERTTGKLKQWRRIATRYDRIPKNYLAILYPAALASRC